MLADSTLTDVGAIVLLVAVVVAGAIRLAVGVASKRRMAPRESAAAEMMRAISDIASAVERLEHVTGSGCSFREGMIPQHVEQWARRIVAESELRRKGGAR